MTDRLTPERRSANMRRIRAADTRPEMSVRRALRELKIGYRLHARDLPGRPDIVIRSRRLAIFVHGCFWHRHPGCRFAYTPKSNLDFWTRKFESNVKRDSTNIQDMMMAGWTPIVIWECETKDASRLKTRLGELIGVPVAPEGSQGENGVPGASPRRCGCPSSA